MDATEAREIIAEINPLLARDAPDEHAIAIANAIQDSRTGGRTSGFIWTIVLAALGYAVYQGVKGSPEARKFLAGGE